MQKKVAQVTVRDYLRIAFRRKWLFIIPFVLASLSAFPIYKILPPKYKATATVRRKDLSVMDSAMKGVGVGRRSSASLSVIRAELLSWPNFDKSGVDQSYLGQVIRRLKFDIDLNSPLEWQRTYERLEGSITLKSIAEGRGVDIVRISATRTDPKRARDIANAIADVYAEHSRGGVKGETEKTIEFLQDGVNENLKELHRVEDEILEFHRLNAAQMPHIKGNYLSKILELGTAKSTKQFELEGSIERLKTIEEQLATVEKEITAEEVTTMNPEAARAKADLAARQTLLTQDPYRNMQEKHPNLRRLREEIAELEGRIKKLPLTIVEREVVQVNPLYRDLLRDGESEEQRIRALGATIRSIESSIKAHEDRIGNFAKIDKRFSDLMREKEQYSNLYGQYQTNLTRARTRLRQESQGFSTIVDILARAFEPVEPAGTPLKMAFVCIVAGVLIGSLFVFVAEFSDHSLRSVEDASAYLKLSVLGSLSKFVTPSEKAHHRRVALAAVLLLSLTVGAAGGGAAWFEREYPGKIRGAIEAVYDRFQ